MIITNTSTMMVLTRLITILIFSTKFTSGFTRILLQKCRRLFLARPVEEMALIRKYEQLPPFVGKDRIEFLSLLLFLVVIVL